MRTCNTALVLSGVVLFGGSSVLAHEGDVGLAVVNGQLQTGIVEVDAVSGDEWVVLGQRVFAGELDGLTGFAADPGFFSGSLGAAGGPVTVPAGAQLGFTINGPLQAWNGAGLGATSARMRLEFAGGALSAVSPTAAGNVAGFGIATGATGAFDEHWDFYATDASGVAGALPSTGVYVLQVTLSLTGTSVSPSEPIWFVLNFGAAEVDHDAAIDWVNANLVPAPGAAGAMLLGAGLVMRRRR